MIGHTCYRSQREEMIFTTKSLMKLGLSFFTVRTVSRGLKASCFHLISVNTCTYLQ